MEDRGCEKAQKESPRWATPKAKKPCKPPHPLAPFLLEPKMVRRGSTVRVRQRALQKPCTAPLSLSDRLARRPACGGYGALYGAFRFRRPSWRRAFVACPGDVVVRADACSAPVLVERRSSRQRRRRALSASTQTLRPRHARRARLRRAQGHHFASRYGLGTQVSVGMYPSFSSLFCSFDSSIALSGSSFSRVYEERAR